MIVTLPPIKLAGIAVRTTNEREMNPATAKIGASWQRFYADGVAGKIPQRLDEHRVYGVYTDYESDHAGEYTQLVAVDVLQLRKDWEGVDVPESRYRVFRGRGPVPQSTMQAWQEVWAHFGAGAEEQRAYTTDLEVYDDREPDLVTLYIAVK